MLKSSLLFFAAAVLVVVFLPLAGRNPQAASGAQAPAPAAKNPARPTAESQAHAKMLYARDCALCHGNTGNGKNTMDLTLDDWTNSNTLANKTDGELFAVIRNGKNTMPAEDVGRADDAQVWNLIIYIRALSKIPQPAPAPAPAPAPSTN